MFVNVVLPIKKYLIRMKCTISYLSFITPMISIRLTMNLFDLPRQSDDAHAKKFTLYLFLWVLGVFYLVLNGSFLNVFSAGQRLRLRRITLIMPRLCKLFYLGVFRSACTLNPFHWNYAGCSHPSKLQNSVRLHSNNSEVAKMFKGFSERIEHG